MTPETLHRTLVEVFGPDCNQAVKLSWVTGLHVRSIHKWLAGDRSIPPWLDSWLRMYRTLNPVKPDPVAVAVERRRTKPADAERRRMQRIKVAILEDWDRGRPMTEIAQRHGKTEAAVRQMVHRAGRRGPAFGPNLAAQRLFAAVDLRG